MVKRHVANALHVAKSMSRKGYANEGAVTEGEQAPFRPLTARSLGERWTPPEQTIEENVGPKARELMENYPQKLGQAIKNAPNAAYEFVKYPGQLLYGEKEYNPEEAVEWSGSLATNMLGASSPFALAKMPTAAEAASTTRIFAGPNAETADMGALRAAMEKKKLGVPEEQIWQEHGWGWNKEGSPYFEIPDNKAEFSSRAKEAFARGDTLEGWDLEAVLKHPELYAAYPDARRTRTTLSPAIDESGTYWEDPHRGDLHRSRLRVEAPSQDQAMGVLMHELTHGVQGVENFPRGGDPKAIANNMRVEIKDQMQGILSQRAQLEKSIEALPPAERPAAMAKVKELTDTYKDMSDYLWSPELTKTAYDKYWLLHGEADARASALRLKMTPEERRQSHPYIGKNTTGELPREFLTVYRPPKKAGGSTIVDKALMLMSSKAKRPRGRP